MEIFGMGPMELILIMVIALIVFGPGRLPEIAMGLGKAIRQFKTAASDVTREVMQEIETSKIKTEAPKSDELPKKE